MIETWEWQRNSWIWETSGPRYFTLKNCLEFRSLFSLHFGFNSFTVVQQWKQPPTTPEFFCFSNFRLADLVQCLPLVRGPEDASCSVGAQELCRHHLLASEVGSVPWGGRSCSWQSVVWGHTVTCIFNSYLTLTTRHSTRQTAVTLTTS